MQDGSRHLATLIDLHNKAIGLKPVKQRNRFRSPLLRLCRPYRLVGQHNRKALRIQPRRDDAARIRGAARARRRIDRHHDALQLSSNCIRHRLLQHGARPQRILAVLDQFAAEFLPAQPRACITPLDRLDETRRKICPVLMSTELRQHDGRIGQKPLHQRRRTRRGGDELARPVSQPKAELKHVVGRLGILPLGQLIAPRSGKLRSAQAFGIFGGKYLRHCPARPQKPSPRRLVAGPVVARDAGYSRSAIDHHLAHVAQRLAHQSDQSMPVARAGERRQSPRQRDHPFGPEPGLARAASAHHQPADRVAPDLKLVGARPHQPFTRRLLCFLRLQVVLQPFELRARPQARRYVPRSVAAYRQGPHCP